jgi:8-amino-7-oxononanoate synthase
MPFDFIKSELEKREAQSLLRTCSVTENKQGRFITVSGVRHLNFSSNDYLGLASDPEIIEAWQEGADLYGVGSGGSSLVTGFNQAHLELIEKLKKWLDVDAIALFSSGYSANQAIIKLLLSKGDLLIQDKLNHASLMEAGVYSDCDMKRFKHNDLCHLNKLLACSDAGNKLIISEGVFSMDGDQAPFSELLVCSKQSNSWLMIDDAHGLGVLGDKGKGSVNAANCDIYMATFGKALGVGGAFIAGSQSLIHYLTNFSKPYIYSTSMPPAMAFCISTAINKVQNEQWRRDKLQGLITEFRRLAQQANIKITESKTAIQPIIIGDSQQAVLIAKSLRDQGFWVTAIRPPTVAKNSARLRITLTVNHHFSDLQKLMDALAYQLNKKACSIEN